MSASQSIEGRKNNEQPEDQEVHALVGELLGNASFELVGALTDHQTRMIRICVMVDAGHEFRKLPMGSLLRYTTHILSRFRESAHTERYGAMPGELYLV